MSGSAPGWVTYAALITSVLAVVVSAIAARIAFLSYRASGPQLHFDVQYKETDAANRRVVMEFTITNKGRGEAGIQGFAMVPYGGSKPVVDVLDIESGPALPARLAGNASETWQVNVLSAAREYDAGLKSGKINPFSSWPSRFRFAAAAGNGNLVQSRRREYDTGAIIADAFPEV